MINPDQARSALNEISRRERQVRNGYARVRPPWWSLPFAVVGYYTVGAGLDFHFPVPALFAAVGFSLIAVFVLVAFWHVRSVPIRGLVGQWSGKYVLVVAVVVAAAFVFHLIVRWVMRAWLPDGPAGMVTAAFDTAVFIVVLVWERKTLAVWTHRAPVPR